MSQACDVRLVLLRPRVPENLGAIARAMKNLGFARWTLVEPRTLDFQAARRVAVHAEDLLERPRIAATLDEAVADSVWVVGTSSRKLRGKRRLTPRELAQEAVKLQGEVAIVFGDERSGLTNEEIDRCHDLSVIPARPEQPSLNLAQAALVYLWEIVQAGASAPAAPPPGKAPATDRELELLEESLRSALRESGFLRGPERHAVRDLLATLRRSKLSRTEARLWIAALRGLGRPASR
jgi:tRNA/rRNA methyltransferase